MTDFAFALDFYFLLLFRSGALGLGRNLSDFRHCSDPLANVRLTDNERTDEAQSDRKEADSNLPPASKKMKQEQEH